MSCNNQVWTGTTPTGSSSSKLYSSVV